MNDELLRSIRETLAYFALFSYPLTAQELHRWLWKPPAGLSFQDMLVFLESHRGAGYEFTGGYYYLPGRESDIARREHAVAIVEQKLCIARRAARILRWLPWVRAVFACNSTAAAVAREGSDVDLFIVTAKNRIWTSRFFVILTLALLRMRIQKTRTANKVCLSFYVTEDHLNIHDIAIGGGDIYLVYWLTQLIPLYDANGYHERIQQENAWIRELTPYAGTTWRMLGRYRVNTNIFQKIVQKSFEALTAGWFERPARALQMKILKKKHAGKTYHESSAVVVSDSLLKFHENDRRRMFREQWQEVVAALTRV